MTHLDEELLTARARGQGLTAPAAAHLAQCATCRTRLEAWANVTAAARQVQAAQGPVLVPSFDALLAPALTARRSGLVQVVAPSVDRSWRLSLEVTGWQLRLLPRVLAVLTVFGLVTGVVLARAVPSSAWGTRVFADLVALVVLAGAVGVAGPRADPRGELWQTLPVSPAAVFWSRLVVVLAGNLVGAAAASGVLVVAGQPGGFGALVAAWLGPALLSAGVTLLGTVWRGPWLGGLAGAMVWAVGSLSTAPFARVDVGLGALASRLWSTTPLTLAIAVLLLVLAARLATGTTRRDLSPAL
jgi:hypothetical protein